MIKGEGRLWPNVTWRDSQPVVFYLGEEDNEGSIEETHVIDFEELLLRLDRDGSVFITMKPGGESELTTPSTEECCKWC